MSTCCGVIALIGAPNVGKSTLLNTLMEMKVAIVSPQVQTTRNRLLAVRTEDDAQIILVDTPGVHKAHSALNSFMVEEALSAAQDADGVLLVIDGAEAVGCQAIPRRDAFVLRRAAFQHVDRVVIAINKCDRIRDREALLPMIEQWQRAGFDSVVPISARRGQGLEGLLAEVKKRLPEGPFMYPSDTITDRSERWLAAEFVREQVLRCCRQEVPHAVAVEVEQFKELPGDRGVHIDASICVERPGQKAIVIGARGQMIKKIGAVARLEVARLLGCPVHLYLNVRVVTDWRDQPRERRRFGYQ